MELAEFRPRSAARPTATAVERPAARVIDAHNHLGRWLSGADWMAADTAGRVATGDWIVPDVGALLAEMDGCDVEAIVNLDGRWGGELEANLDRYDRAHPGRFATFCAVDFAECRTPGFDRRLVASLERSISAGARGLKVWKTLGLGFRDPAGELLMPGDPRLGDVWELAGAKSLPVLIHTADPVAFFDPIDERNERIEELAAHPDWWFGGPGMPSFLELMQSLEQLVADHPRTTFIVAHIGCYAEAPTEVDRMLATYPNYVIDISARIAEMGRQPRATRRLIENHHDRVLFGTDSFPPDGDVWRRYFRVLETDDEWFPYADQDPPPTGRWNISALDLPPAILPALYAENARRVLDL